MPKHVKKKAPKKGKTNQAQKKNASLLKIIKLMKKHSSTYEK
jgi:hypothetical protein